MARLRSRGPGVLSIALVGAVGCAPLAGSPAEESVGAGRAGAYRIAVAPVSFALDLERQAAADPETFAEASIHVGHYLGEALLERGYGVVPARDSEGTLVEVTRSSDLHRDASELARFAVERLGVDALLVVELTRWTPRGARSTAPPRPITGCRSLIAPARAARPRERERVSAGTGSRGLPSDPPRRLRRPSPVVRRVLRAPGVLLRGAVAVAPLSGERDALAVRDRARALGRPPAGRRDPTRRGHGRATVMRAARGAERVPPRTDRG